MYALRYALHTHTHTHTHTQCLFFIQKRSYVNIYCFVSCFLYLIIYLGDHFLQNTGVGCHALLQGILLTQGLKLGLPHCRWTLFTVWATPHFSRTSSKFSSIINLCVLHFCWLCLYSLFIYKFLDGNNVVFRIPVYSNAYAEWVLNKLFFKWIWIFYEDLCIEHSLHKTLKIISFSPLNEILLKIIM